LTNARAFLSALARDVRGNTIAIMAAALVPLAGMVGGGVDISRMYIVKTRLQHACDAGALAGRKAMAAGVWSQSNYMPRTEAEKFFDANIQASPYGATTLTRAFAESGGKVTGTASAVVPMTLMRIFGRTTETLSVTCDAEMRLPNTDVMFVLDVTGSMDDKAVSSDTDDKITSLKKSVKCFFEVVANLNTNATCTTTPAGGGIPNTVQIRFGFMPYSTNVNVGKLLPTSYFANSWPYQSREAVYRDQSQTTVTQGTPYQYQSPSDENEGTGSWSTETTWDNVTSSWCNNQSVPANSATTWDGTETNPYSQSQTGSNPIVYSWRTQQDGWYYEYQRTYSSWQDRCRIQRRRIDIEQTRYWRRSDTSATTTTQVFDEYRYARLTKDISGLKSGTSWNSSFQLPIGTNGANKTISWDGCIEERRTVRTTDFDPIPADADDLDIDAIPSQSDANSLWGPALPDMIYTRQLQSGGWWGTTGSMDRAEVNTDDEYLNASSYYCPREARKLQSWSTASSFETYVDSLTPTGNTYHDIGLLWGARFMSAEGIFASENAHTPAGGDIARHMIFMTDGEACTGATNYTAYGIPWYDRRQTPDNTVPTDGCLTTGTLTQQVNLRTAALCEAVKNKNITLWVIWFGASNTTIEDMLEDCATDGRYFAARNSADLQQTFSSIASQISQLRLTR
jgi:Flp pilus assembly protein TadG